MSFRLICIKGKSSIATIITVKMPIQKTTKRQISIQSMCDTKTENVSATVKQILELEREGCDMVRVAVPTIETAKAIAQIKRRIHIPLVADIHFDPKLALEAIKAGADKVRINPGNIVRNLKNADELNLLKKIIEAAKSKKIPIRIGVNSGSLEKHLVDKYGGPTPKALVESALKWIAFFESQKFINLVISIKSTDTETTIEANELLYKALKRRIAKTKRPIYKIHLGVTEAGTLIPGITRNAIALSHLLRKGIGDTIRISLTESPIFEIKAAKELLKALNLYTKEPIIISCPTCGRTEIDLKNLVKQVENGLKKLKIKKAYKIAIMGCVVNGPGEAAESDFAICGGKKMGAIYRKGKLVKTCPEKVLVKEFLKLIKP